jgi:hypothetical protein
MRALVIYESMFGNTRDIAFAIGEGLAEQCLVEVVEVGAAGHEIDPQIDLLVVGGPTHVFGLSRPSTRKDAEAKRGSTPVSAGLGIREWFEEAGRADADVHAAAFDTKIDKHVPGAAANGVARRLRRLGYRIALEGESFHVTDVAGPLAAGELDRARAWGELLGVTVRHAGSRRASR